MNCKQHLKVALTAKTFREDLNLTYPANKSLFDPKFVQFAEFLSTAMGFSYDIIGGAAGTRLQSNGTWTGVIGKVHQGIADLAISPLIITEERVKTVNFSYPYFVDSLTFVVRKMEQVHELSAILRPLDCKVWILLIITLISMVIFFYLILEDKSRFSDIFLKVIAILLRQQVTLRTNILHKRVLIFAWLIGSTFLSSCYISVLLSYTMFPTMKIVKDIPALSKVVNEGKYRVIVRKDSPVAEMLASSIHYRVRILGEAVYKNPEGKSSVDNFLRPSDPNVAFIEWKRRISHLHNLFFISKDYFFSVGYAIAVSKKLRCRKKLDTVIHRITASGLYEKLLLDDDFHNAFALFTKVDFSTPSSKSLTLSNLSSAFFVLISGYVFSCCILIFEMLIEHLKKRLHKILKVKTIKLIGFVCRNNNHGD